MLKGIVHLILRDINTGEITWEHTQENDITDSFKWQMANAFVFESSYDNGYIGRFGASIFIGRSPQITNRSEAYMFDIYGFGANTPDPSPAFLSGNIGTSGTFAYYYEYHQVFTPPAADRDIYTVGIDRDFRNYYQRIENYNNPSVMSCMLGLTTPCTQTSTETLDVFYRIIWDNPDPAESGMSNEMMHQLARRHWHNRANSWSNTYGKYPYENRFTMQGRKMLDYARGKTLSAGGVGEGSVRSYAGGGFWVDGGAYNARRLQFTVALGQLTGRIVGTTIGCRNGTSATYTNNAEWGGIFWNVLLRDWDSVTQNIFNHRVFSYDIN